MNKLQQELLRQSRASFNRAQQYYHLGLWSSAATVGIGLIAALQILYGKGDLATLTALTNLLPTITCRHVVQQAAKQLEDASERLRLEP